MQLIFRFFKGTTNPVSGTVVDDVVTLPERYDFYLVSQSVRQVSFIFNQGNASNCNEVDLFEHKLFPNIQGTVNPTSYNVIHDTSGLTADKIQKLSYKLCHLYYNWPGLFKSRNWKITFLKLAFYVIFLLTRMPSPDLIFFGKMFCSVPQSTHLGIA